jgi:hypothetical protein
VGDNRPILEIPAEESAYMSKFIYAVRKTLERNTRQTLSFLNSRAFKDNYLNVNQYGFSLNKDQIFQIYKQVLKSEHLNSQGKGNSPNAAAAAATAAAIPDNIERNSMKQTSS